MAKSTAKCLKYHNVNFKTRSNNEGCVYIDRKLPTTAIKRNGQCGTLETVMPNTLTVTSTNASCAPLPTPMQQHATPLLYLGRHKRPI